MDEVPLLDALKNRLSAPIAIDSDRSGYVLGEAWLGAARGLRDVVFVAIGTGIAAANVTAIAVLSAVARRLSRATSRERAALTR